MQINKKKSILLICALTAGLIFNACSYASPAEVSDLDTALSDEDLTAQNGDSREESDAQSDDSVRSAVNFEHELDSYKPQKDHYNFYFTYKTVHPWWDAVALGMEEAQRQFLDKGITVTYEYMAPAQASAQDQTQRLLEAQKGDYNVIGVDVADEKIISPLLDKMVDDGTKVMTFSSSDAADGCKRIAYVGNTHNYQDGADLTGLRSLWEASARRAMRTVREVPQIPSPNMPTCRSLPQNTIWIPWILLMTLQNRY